MTSPNELNRHLQIDETAYAGEIIPVTLDGTDYWIGVVTEADGMFTLLPKVYSTKDELETDIMEKAREILRDFVLPQVEKAVTLGPT